MVPVLSPPRCSLLVWQTAIGYPRKSTPNVQSTNLLALKEVWHLVLSAVAVGLYQALIFAGNDTTGANSSGATLRCSSVAGFPQVPPRITAKP